MLSKMTTNQLRTLCQHTKGNRISSTIDCNTENVRKYVNFFTNKKEKKLL